MKLNKTQVDYAIKRLNENITKKISDELGPRPKDKKEDNAALIAYITSKKAKLKPDLDKVFANNSYAKYGVQAMYDFPEDFNKERDLWNEKEKLLQTEYAKKKQTIVDQLHLSGDAETALSLINTI
jgi:hypothetical protein